MIDLISDTVTKPTTAMLQAMAQADVGDDVYGEDPTVAALERKSADLFGIESALFCASGTMTNQIAIMIHCRPGDEVLCHRFAHIYAREGGGIMANAGASVRLLGDDRGMIAPEEVASALGPSDLHSARTSMIAIENTSNFGGGTCHDFQVLEEIGAIARDASLAYHLDGARLFNAIIATADEAQAYGALFDSISICLSKGLGCPVGSLLLGDADFIDEAKRVRKRLGGGWRQAGFLAAAGIYALDHHVERLAEDHKKATRLFDCLTRASGVVSIKPVETNIVVLRLRDGEAGTAFCDHLSAHDIRAYHGGDGLIRLVTHIDVSMAQIEQVCSVIEAMQT